MQPVFLMAPPASLFERLIVGCLGFALACMLARLVVGTTPPPARVLVSFGAVLAIVVGSSLLADDRSVLAFLAGAVGGVTAVPRSIRADAQLSWRTWRLPLACLALGPLLGSILFGVAQLSDNISPLDQLYYLRVFLAVGSFAGLLSAGVASLIVSHAVRHSA